MSDMMTFPDTWEEYAESYGFVDRDEVYTNGARLIPTFRVSQWLEHLEKKPDVSGKWILCSERLPEKDGVYLCTFDIDERACVDFGSIKNGEWYIEPLAWMPVPRPWRGEPDGQIH